MGNERHDGRLRTSRNRLILAALAAALFSATPSRADANDALAERWYAALQDADAERLGELLSPNAVIKLNDLGISQTKADFIESMGEWKSAIEGGTIRHRPDGVVEDASAYKVCYSFKTNELLTREVFTFTDGRIVSSEQTTISDSCKDF